MKSKTAVTLLFQRLNVNPHRGGGGGLVALYGVIRHCVQWKLPAQVLKDPRPMKYKQIRMLIAKFVLVFYFFFLSLYRADARRFCSSKFAKKGARPQAGCSQSDPHQK